MECVRRSWSMTFKGSFAIWTFLALYFCSQGLIQRSLSGNPTPVWHYFVAWFTGSYISAALTPLVLWLGHKYPFRRKNWMRLTALHLTFSFAFAVVQLLVESALLSSFGVFPTIMISFGATLVFLGMTGFHQNILTYWIIFGLQRAFDVYRESQRRKEEALKLELRTSELNAQLTHAHLSALKAQLQPHFLFNALNAITVLARQRKIDEAEEMLARLSDLLRCVLDDVETQEVQLRRELDYLHLYLSIEEIRFKDRLVVKIDAEPGVLDAAFPHMGLQPLVENAIRHGIGRRSASGHICITASRVHDLLQVVVEDDGPGFSSSNSSHSAGIGLSNTRARLEQLYGETGRLTTENAPGGGAIVTVWVPFRTAPDEIGLEWMDAHAFDSTHR
jgi:two-component system, LytTR family, sensor kinase